MKKTITAVICAALCTAFISACGGTKTIDADTAASKLMSSGIFAEQLEEVNTSVAEKRLSLNSADVESCKAYAGTKAVVDEIAIIKAVSPDAAANVKAAIDKHLETQKKSYSSYRPDEVPKLDNAVVITEGSSVAFVVSKDSDRAKQIVKDCLK